MRCIKGKLQELMNDDVLELLGASKEDYVQATLTDTEELIDPIGTLRSVYPNVLQILLEKNEIIRETEYESRLTGSRKEIEELFADFYELVKGEALDEVRQQYVTEAAKAARAMVEKGGDKEE
jgi:exonuclease SbcD